MSKRPEPQIRMFWVDGKKVSLTTIVVSDAFHEVTKGKYTGRLVHISNLAY
jgi:hypothetical protein